MCFGCVLTNRGRIIVKFPIALALGGLLSFAAWSGDVYYLSAVGDDIADGRSPETAWRTLAKVKNSLPGGAELRLRRGDVFHGSLRIKGGPDADHPTRVVAWGEGAKPVISLYKMVRPDPVVWQSVGDGLWRLDLAKDGNLVGNPAKDNNFGFIWADGKIHGFRKFNGAPLIAEWDFAEGKESLCVRCTRNPAEVAKDIRLAPQVGGIPFVKNAFFDSLVVRGTGAHGSSGVGSDLVFRNCEFREIGGSVLTVRKGGTHVRYGNGVECWAGSTRIRVEDCAFSDIYDVAFTMQGDSPVRSWENVHMIGCVVERCTQAFEVWTRECKPGVGMKGCSFERNRCVDCGFCWGYDTRPNKDSSAPLLVFTLDTDVCDILVSDNEFVNFRNYLVYKSGGLSYLPGGYRIVGNRIRGTMTAVGNPPRRQDRADSKAREECIRKSNDFVR